MKKIIFTLLLSYSVLSAYTVSTTFDDEGTDYNNTQTVIYSGSENLDVSVFNLFLSFIEQSRPDLTLNKGEFAAKIIDNVSNEEYDVIADVTRADNDSPMYIKMWFKMNFGTESIIIYTQFQVDEAPSTLYPLGVWSFKYTLYLNDAIYANGIAAVSKSDDKQRLEWVFESIQDANDNSNLAFEFDAASQEGVAISDGTTYSYNQRYMEYNATHYEDALNATSVEIYEYNIFDRDGAKVEFTTRIFFEFTLNGVHYYGQETNDGIYINDAVTFTTVDLNTSTYDDVAVESFDGNSYTITNVAGVRKLLQSDGTTVSYNDELTLVSDTNASLTAIHYGEWIGSGSTVFENGHHFNGGEYYIKQVYGVKNLVKVLQSSVLDEDKPSSTSVISESTLVPTNVKVIIGDIPTDAPLLLKYGEEL